MARTLVVGAGPVGLFLAAELTRAGHAPLVVERLPRPTGLSKALGIQGAGVALIEARGLLPEFAAEASSPPPGAVGMHFAGLALAEPSAFLFVMQARVEALLESQLQALGTRVVRDCELIALEQREDHVAVTLRVGERSVHEQFEYVVGCDGGRSAVRRLARFVFPGCDPTTLLRLGDVRMPGCQMTPEGLMLPSGVRAPFGVGVPLGDGYHRVVTREPYDASFDRDAPFELSELEDSLRRTTGLDIPVAEPRWLSRFTDASRQAARYRDGRVFLAGDAAHIHLPAGGPGISTGLLDAANLAWRLGAVLAGHQPEVWLDGYHDERHPAGAQVIQHTRAQGALFARTHYVLALRQLLGELFEIPEARRFVARRVQGMDARYGADPNPLVGRFMPQPVALHDARFVLLAPRDLRVENVWGPRLELRVSEGPAMLLRPDGFVAWAGDGSLQEALSAWLGTP